MRRAIVLGAIFAGCFLGFKAAAGEYPGYTPEASRCGKDLQALYSFWERNIANTPNPQLTLETGLYVKRDGTVVTYAAELHQEAGYAANWC